MERMGRDAPLPDAMQGRWVIEDEPASELVVAGGEVVFIGRAVAYDYKVIEEIDGALIVGLRIDDEARKDTFTRENITGLVITPDGKFQGWNVKFATQFVRAAS